MFIRIESISDSGKTVRVVNCYMNAARRTGGHVRHMRVDTVTRDYRPYLSTCD